MPNPQRKSLFKPLPEYEEKICSRVAVARRLKGLGQKELANKINLTRNQLANIEAKRVPLKFGIAMAFCKAIAVNPQWLYGGQEPQQLILDLEEWTVLRLCTHRPATENFSTAWAAVGEDIIFFGNTIERKLEDQGSESGKRIEELVKAWKVDTETSSIAPPIWLSHKPEKTKTHPPKNKGKHTLDNAGRLSDKGFVNRKIRSLPDLIKNLRELTKARGLKAELARKCHVTRQAFGQWLSGKSKPSAEATFLLLNWVEQKERPKQKTLTVR